MYKYLNRFSFNQFNDVLLHILKALFLNFLKNLIKFGLKRSNWEKIRAFTNSNTNYGWLSYELLH